MNLLCKGVIPLNASIVPAVLKEGMMIGVRIGRDSPWHGNIVYEVAGDTVRIAYMDKFMKSLAVSGCPVWVKYSNDFFIYYFHGKVKSISSDYPEYVLIKLETAEEMINNRLYPRYDVRLEADIRPVWDNESYKAVITDLSYGGAAFMCEHKFESNENIEMLIYLPDTEPAKVTGKVIRRRNSGSSQTDHAAQFIECDNASNKQLCEYFKKLENEVSEVYRRYIEKSRR